MDWPATAALLVIAAVVVGIAVALYVLRDLESAALRLPAGSRPPRYLPSANPLLRIPVVADLYEQRIGLFAWIAGTALAAVFITSIAAQTGDFITSTPGMAAYAATLGGSAQLTRAIIGSIDYAITALLLSIYALTVVARWAADDQEGRLELVLSQPLPRWRVVVARIATLACGSLLIILAASAAAAIVAPSQHVTITTADLFRAGAPLVPFALLFGTVGATITARFPRLAVGVLGTYLVASYLIFQLGPFLRWPAWSLDFSVFKLYGNPLSSGIDWTGLSIMSAVALAGFAAALLVMQRREVGS